MTLDEAVRAPALPGLGPEGVWTVRKRGDAAARLLADRHYSRKSVGAAMFTPPGRCLVLVTPCERAVWVTSWTDYPPDGIYAYRCAIFRNEGAPGRSSDLIRAAMAETYERWGARHAGGWVTWVDTAKVQSTNPGYCFLAAGWWRDKSYQPAGRRRTLVRLRAS